MEPEAPSGALAPFKNRAFLLLWVGVVLSSIGSWSQTVGAQWLFINDPNAATIISLVQTATALPMVLLALVGGVLSDAFDRRRLMLWVQVYFVVIALLLSVLTGLKLMPPLLLLAFTFAIGVGNAIQLPTWQPLITELVPRSQIAAATRLDMVSVNVARAVGPAIAGLVIAAFGVPPTFAFNAACTLFLIVAILTWRREPAVTTRVRERFLPALRAGGRYVRHEPVVRLILIRLAMFIAPGTAMWALLPLIAHNKLGLGAAGYGILFAAVGLGAVTAAFTLARLKKHLSANTILSIVALAFAITFALTMVVPGLLPALPLLCVMGFGWTATVSTLNAELQLYLPGWVRARAIAVYLMTFTGAQAIAAPIWGQIAQHVSLEAAVWIASGVLAVVGLVGFAWHFPESENLDRAPLSYWSETNLIEEPDPDAGPIQVVVEYVVPRDRQDEWLAAMTEMRRSRLRSGAFRWELYRVGERSDTFMEIFAVPSWAEHQSQHDIRLTVQDQAIEELAFSFVSTPPTSVHLLPATAPLVSSEGDSA